MDTVFISYSHQDEDWKNRVQSHLSVLQKHGKLNIWDDRQIPLGGDWLGDIEQSLEQASIALLLVSRHFLTSDFVNNKEIPKLLQRREQDGLKVIPIMLTPCSWDHVDWLSAIQGYPKDNKPLSGLNEHQVDEALAKLASHLPKHGAALNEINTPETQATPQTTEAQHVVINNFSGITLEQYEEGLIQQEKRLRQEFRELLGQHNPDKGKLLTLELDTVQNRLLNLQSSYEETLSRLEEADDALEQLKDELPELQVEKARELLAKNDKQAAKEAFGDIVAKGSTSVALAAYEKGKLEEDDIKYAEAMAQYEIAVTLEKQNPDYLSAAGIMARTLGNYSDALKWLDSLLNIHLQTGDEHLELAFVQNELGSLYKDIGEYAKAKPLYQRSLDLYEKSLGNDHPDVATILNNLALLYEKQGEYVKAEPSYQRALAIVEKLLGNDHPSVAITLHNLAELYHAQGKYSKAEPLFQRSLIITETSLGNDHPNVATTLNNLAELYRTQGRYAKAEPLHKHSLDIRERSLGNDHPDVATTLNNLAILFYKQGKIAEAINHMQRAVDIWEKRLPPTHPNLIRGKSNLKFLKSQPPTQ